ncbi:hypothetical protein BC830DRAFT_1096804 [Chytriomyces sp. MP71]|nr:hypothetical protein BC830DRAFT_1096804 [Chytriomyces sp. MP71]
MFSHESKHSQMASVVVIGAGPSGLCLARILQINGVAVKVYEADASPTSRPQGGSLDLHKLTGQRAIAAAKLTDKFLEKTEAAADGMSIMDHVGTVLYTDTGDGSRPEIQRTALRDILLASLEEGTVAWGHKLERIDPMVESNNVAVHFSNGASVEAGFVVGADGTWSKVRPYLTSAIPSYTGVSLFDIHLPLDMDLSHFARGTLVAMDKNKNVLMGHVLDIPNVYVSKWCNAPGELQKTSTPESILKDFAPQLRAMGQTSAAAIPRDIFALPIGLTWTRDAPWKNRLAIIGDAAHVMSPFAGEGANLALADAVDLANALIKVFQRQDWQENVGAAVTAFEKKLMWPRSKNAAQESHDNLNMFYGDGGAPALVQKFKEMMSWPNMIRMGLAGAWDYVLRLFGFDSAAY